MSYHTYATHGVNTIVEFPERTARIVRAGWGTRIEQSGGSQGWFHLPLPTLAEEDSDSSIWVKRVELKADLNENAEIVELHLRMGEELIATSSRLLRGPSVSTSLELPKNNRSRVKLGLTLCVRARFLTGNPPIGTVDFRSASVIFWE